MVLNKNSAPSSKGGNDNGWGPEEVAFRMGYKSMRDIKGALLGSSTLGKGIVLSTEPERPQAKPIHPLRACQTQGYSAAHIDPAGSYIMIPQGLARVYWLEAYNSYWQITAEKYYLGPSGIYLFRNNYFGEVKILSIPDTLTDQKYSFE